jgi:hypothetical protein
MMERRIEEVEEVQYIEVCKPSKQPRLGASTRSSLECERTRMR